MMKNISEFISEKLDNLFTIQKNVELNRPNNDFGDYSTNIAMQISGIVKNRL